MSEGCGAELGTRIVMFFHNESGGLPCFVDGRLFSSDGVPDLQITFHNARFERRFAVATASDGLIALKRSMH